MPGRLWLLPAGNPHWVGQARSSLDRRLEQDHRSIRNRIGCTPDFKRTDAAWQFCGGDGGFHDSLRPHRRHNTIVFAVSLGNPFAIDTDIKTSHEHRY